MRGFDWMDLAVKIAITFVLAVSLAVSVPHSENGNRVLTECQAEICRCGCTCGAAGEPLTIEETTEQTASHDSCGCEAGKPNNTQHTSLQVALPSAHIDGLAIHSYQHHTPSEVIQANLQSANGLVRAAGHDPPIFILNSSFLI